MNIRGVAQKLRDNVSSAIRSRVSLWRARRAASQAIAPVRTAYLVAQAKRTAVDRHLDESAVAYVTSFRDGLLKSRPVESLKDLGAANVRWSALKSAGVQTVFDLKAQSASSLDRIPGIGDVSATSVLQAARSLTAQIADEPVAMPSLELNDPSAQELVAAARTQLWSNTELGPATERLKDRLDAMEVRLKSVRRGTGILNFLFPAAWLEHVDTAERESASLSDDLEAVRQDKLLDEISRATYATDEMIQSACPGDTLRTDFQNRYADYCATLEDALQRAAGGATVRKASVSGGLPEQIAKRAEGFPLQAVPLKITLRTYQAFGAKYLLAQKRCLLGDEMGLGKTIQALAGMVHLARVEHAKHFVVVAPASITRNWLREIEHCTDLQGFHLQGHDRGARLDKWWQEGGVAVTSFPTLSSGDLLARMQSENMRTDMVVVDEAHFVKNPAAERTKAIDRLLKIAERAVFMTGTPLENRLDEFCHLVRMLRPELSTLDGSDFSNGHAVEARNQFKHAVAEVYLRRNQQDVLAELPPRIEKEEWVELTPQDERAYRDAVVAGNFMAMRQAATIGLKEPMSAKLERFTELVDDYRSEEKKLLVFSFFTHVLEELQKHFPGAGRICGAVPQDRRMEIVDAFQRAPGHQILIGQIEAMGVGLNLQAANAVVLMEPQWKPTVENQAIARAHRMGQTGTVVVHRLLARDCVDEHMLKIVRQKQMLFDQYARDSAVKDFSRQATQKTFEAQILEQERTRITREMAPVLQQLGSSSQA